MMQIASALRICAVVVATCAMSWLLLEVNRHGDDTTLAAATVLRPSPAKQPVAPEVRPAAAGGLDLVDMYECMCASYGDEIGRWVWWWMMAAVFGGLPVAILLRQRDNERQQPSLS